MTRAHDFTAFARKNVFKQSELTTLHLNEITPVHT